MGKIRKTIIKRNGSGAKAMLSNDSFLAATYC